VPKQIRIDSPRIYDIFRHVSKPPAKTRVPVAKKVLKKVGRPAAGKDKRLRIGEIKASKSEQKRLQANAKKAGYSSVVVWLRELGLKS